MITISPARAVVDFNLLDAEGLVPVLAEDVTGFRPTSTGEFVELVDEDGNACLGVVVRREDERLDILPAWETWRSSSWVRFSMPGVAATPLLLEMLRGRPALQPRVAEAAVR